MTVLLPLCMATFGVVSAVSIAQEPSAATTPQDGAELRLPLRVTSAVRGAIGIDRGARDGVQLGDRVSFLPARGGVFAGTVRQVDERSAIVEPDESAFVPEPGTRGETRIPRQRLAPPPDPAPSTPPSRGETSPPPPQPSPPPPWPERADGWEPGMPLLAKVRPVEPAAREPRFMGRIWSAGGLVHGATDDAGSTFANSQLRVGTDLRFENALGRGETLELDFEVAHRADFDDDRATGLLLRTLAYREGGTRFAPTRWQVGRFLQHAMPEFGWVDGLEWGHRTEDGHRLAASIGWQPNEDDELSTGDDFQVAASFRWVADGPETLSFDVGYQKTFHHADADRDLFVLKGRWVGEPGWDVSASAWLDTYLQSRDDAKGQTFELTQAWLAVRRFETDGSGYEFSYRRRAFPLTLRREFEPRTPAELDDEHVDRVALAGHSGARGTDHWRAELSGWADEREHGGALELGKGYGSVFLDGDELALVLFGSLGEFTSVAGVRVELGRSVSDGRWDLLYEFANHHLAGRPPDGDDLLQHRLRASRSFAFDSGWNLAFHGDLVLWDDDFAYGLGFFVQRSF